ncbi:uncharacterized protein LOC107044560 [Diachasma alloeum]|uniref:uncharacterized protein LOC107044560 n=1 Tax=Diachasma alloeum TaxID=454923 RepID=UPI00073834BA|nr:uncharacterized protein LOC107044560 [Diachasma alloeum]
MEYTSCIRIRGVPILPPLMTEELRSEMSYYKQLALSVEEKLSRQRLTPEGSPDTLKTVSTPRISRKSSKAWSKTEETLSDDETTLTKSTDLNRYLVNPSDTSEGSSEASKPRIPTSLDIIPISLEPQPLKKSKSSSSIQNPQEEPRKLVRQGSYTLDTPSPMLLAHIEVNRPEYVPSGQQKRRDFKLNDAKSTWTCQNALKNGVGGAGKHPRRVNGSLESIDIQSSRESRKKTFRGPLERSKSSNEVKNRYLNEQNRNLGERSRYLERSQGLYEVNGNLEGQNRNLRRRDSYSEKIQEVKVSEKNFDNQNRNFTGQNRNIADENLNSPKNRSSNRDIVMPIRDSKSKNQNVDIDLQKESTPKNFETINRNFSQNRNFDLENRRVGSKEFYFEEKKLGGSLGDLLNSSNDISTAEPDERMTKSLDINDFEAGTSERLLGVFREIQRTHDRQMADLIERQQREQAFMQEAFEKQQLMLLEQIDKTFPGISIMELVKRVGEGERKKDWKNEEFSSSFDSDGSMSINLGESGLEGSPEGKMRGVSRQLFPLEVQTRRIPVVNGGLHDPRHIQAATVINAYARGFLVRRMMKTEQIISLKNTYREALHCMLKLTVDAPLELAELNFHKRLQLQCDAASMNIVELFSQSPSKRMEIIAHDRQIKKARTERPSSARSSMSFATQRTLARKKLKELGIFQLPEAQSTSRTRCQTWTSNNRDKKSPGIVYRGIKRSTSAGAVRKPWR